MIDDFQSTRNERWEFISDQVMGGVSTGKMLFKNQEVDGYLHLTGNVSTKNQGGFIQARTSLKNVLTNDIKGIKIRALIFIPLISFVNTFFKDVRAWINPP